MIRASDEEVGPRRDGIRLGTQVQEALARRAIETAKGTVFGACSFGVAIRRASDASLEGLLGRADAALYAAKTNTRVATG
jgi:PleD family two-component response regulator